MVDISGYCSTIGADIYKIADYLSVIITITTTHPPSITGCFGIDFGNVIRRGLIGRVVAVIFIGSKFDEGDTTVDIVIRSVLPYFIDKGAHRILQGDHPALRIESIIPHTLGCTISTLAYPVTVVLEFIPCIAVRSTCNSLYQIIIPVIITVTVSGPVIPFGVRVLDVVVRPVTGGRTAQRFIHGSRHVEHEDDIAWNDRLLGGHGSGDIRFQEDEVFTLVIGSLRLFTVDISIEVGIVVGDGLGRRLRNHAERRSENRCKRQDYLVYVFHRNNLLFHKLLFGSHFRSALRGRHSILPCGGIGHIPGPVIRLGRLDRLCGYFDKEGGGPKLTGYLYFGDMISVD